MKNRLPISFASLLLAGHAAGASLYQIGNDTQESLPLKWSVGADLTYDDNVAPGGAADGTDSMSINPYVGLSFVKVTPQTTVDVYARLGLIYYFDQDSGSDIDDVNTQSRAGVNITHRFTERLRLSSQNFVSYELEPDYSQGVSSSRALGEYFFWQTDNALGYRWTDRFATYTGFQLTGLTYDDVDNADRFTWTLYNQFRYQLGPRTVVTLDYRYGQTEADGLASNSADHFILAGVEQRFSPTTILVAKAGAQIREVDDGDNSTSPFFELTANTQVTEVFSVRAFARYSLESYDSVQFIDGSFYDFSERQTLRVGVAGDYMISKTLSLGAGVDYIPSSFDSGNLVGGGSGPATQDGLEEDIFNAFIALTVRFTDNLSASVGYNYTDSSSDFDGRDYDRNRFTVGVRAEF